MGLHGKVFWDSLPQSLPCKHRQFQGVQNLGRNCAKICMVEGGGPYGALGCNCGPGSAVGLGGLRVST